MTLLRQDNAAVGRYHIESVQGQPSARDLRDFEVVQSLGIDPATIQVVCLNEGTIDQGTGVVSFVSNVLLRADNLTAVVVANVTPLPGLPTSSLSRRVVMAPTAEFSARALDTFLAIDWQLLVGENSNLFDSDGDGWRDGVDEFPQDPTRH